MQIDVSQTLLDIYGNPIKNSDKNDDVLTLKQALILALSKGTAPNEGLSPSQCLARLDLASKIQSAEKEMELKSEEITELKKLVAALVLNIGLNPLAAGMILKSIDP